MLLDAKFLVFGVALLASCGRVLAGPVDNKPVDVCKEVKKEVQSLQEPKTRKAATAYCSQYLDLPEITETTDVFVYTTDFNLEPETYTPYAVTTLPPGTVTETDTYTRTIDTNTIVTTLYFGCPTYEAPECLTGWESSTILITAVEDRATTITKTITQSPNPLPTADPTRLSKACECLSIPLATTTRTDTGTYVYAPYTVTGPTVTWTNYNNVVLEIETTTIEYGISDLTLPVTIMPQFTETTEYYAFPTIIVTSTIYPSAAMTHSPKPTKTPGPSKTKCRTTRVHPPKPTKTKPPRKGGKGGKGGKN